MSDVPITIPEGYEILRTIDTSASVSEHVARRKVDDALVRLKIFSFSKASGATTRRHLREYLRCDITFMEELELDGVVRIIDYSDTKDLFWIATQPAEVEKLSRRFDFLASQSFEFRQQLARQFLTALQQIHTSRVIHRNLSSDAVFLSSQLQIYIGELGFASYFTTQTTTTQQDTTMVTTMGYQPPEVRDAKTFTCDVSCDIFSAGLLTYEILFATALPKDNPTQICEILRTYLNERVAQETITIDTVQVILKAVNLLPQKRWQTAAEFADALEKSFQDKSTYKPVSTDPFSAVAVTKPPVESDKTVPVQTTPDTAQQPSQLAKTESADTIIPLDPSHEIWNNRYEIIKKIGEGGQAVVYKAHDHLTNEEVAIKTMWSRHRDDRSAINRLKQGAMIARSLTHRYIIKTYSVEQRLEADGLSRYVFVCMELIKSQMDLAAVIETRRTSGKKIRLDETLHITRQLLDALVYAHEYTIHRDIKPGNIMLVPRDEQTGTDTSDLTKFDIRLIDFGIAKVLSQKHIDVTGKGFRSAHYGAPELADAKTGVDARADLYSAGVIMYQMLTLNIPRKGSPPANKINKEVPAALANVIDKSINAEREKRFKTASEFIKEIDRAVSKFNWLRKSAKIAAGFIIAACIAYAIKYFLPQPNYGSVQQSIEILDNRNPDKEIAVFADNTIIKHSDIEGYNNYETLRETALENLKIVKMAGNNRFNKRTFSPWKQQEDVWGKIEPATEKIERIALDQRQFNARKDLIVMDHLAKLNPSSKIVSKVKEKTQKAEVLLDARPLSRDILDTCADSYDLGAKVYTNIDALSDGVDTPRAAQQINDKLIDVEKLRDSSLVTRNSLDTIEQLKVSGFHERSDKCFEKADRYYQTFELPNARKYFNLLGQICGTITYAKNQIDFNRSDIGLVSSRLMELCYQDIETFENYPAWTERLEQVYQKKDVLAKFRSIQNLLAKGPQNVPSAVYNLTASALEQYEQGNMTSAGEQLTKALGEYKKFIRTKFEDLRHDCDSLLTFSFASTEKIENCKTALDRLSSSLDEMDWPQPNFADDYSRCSQDISNEKKAVREQLSQQALDLKKKIVDSSNKAQQQSSFWKSRLIGKYIAVARYYDTDDIDTSITSWKYVENLSRLSVIVNQMGNISSRLDQMLTRKDRLDQLSKGIDKAGGFCEKFKGTSPDERKKYKQWGLELKQLNAQLTIPHNNTYLIDQSDETFSAEFNNINSAFLEIRAKLPFHRSRVIELINQSRALKKTADNINELQKQWTYVLTESNILHQKPDFSQMRNYLESIKDDVDNWSTDSFNRQMQDNCENLAATLQQQNQATSVIISAVLNEKSELTDSIESFEKKVDKILADKDIRTLDNIAADDSRQALLTFRQLPNLLSSRRRQFSNINLSDPRTSSNAVSQDIFADFEVDTWLENFNSKKDLLNTRISQLQALEDTVAVFQQTRQILSQQSSTETEYYLALRDSTTALIDYSDITAKIETVEADNVAVKMCIFLEQMDNDTVPKLKDLKASVTTITNDLSNLKSMQVSTLTEAKDFNGKREQLLSQITTLQQQAGKFTRTNLENSCKKSVTDAVDQIKNLITTPDQTDTINKLSSSLWAFFPDHKNWRQWNSFLELYHVAVSDDGLYLASSDLLRAVNEKGQYLNLAEIAANSKKLFFINTTNLDNFGWPRYINHQKDPTVILAFVPGNESSGIEPFYMAAREISNAQYKLFLEKSGAKPTTKLTGWSYFGDQSNNLLIGQAQGQFPPCAITWDKSTSSFIIDEESKQAPVTWITSYGGRAYAQWFGAQLPTPSQHAFAARGGADTLYPWGNDFSNAASYAHIRSAAWKNAARQYNAKRDDPVKVAYPPVGAIKDFLRGKALDPAKIVHSKEDNLSVWPCFTINNKPNVWGLYDIIGNVWEWCRNPEDNSPPVICGGSSLSPPKYITPDSKYEFNAQACDVGFRIVIPVK